jgi:hypothetical protein
VYEMCTENLFVHIIDTNGNNYKNKNQLNIKKK